MTPSEFRAWRKSLSLSQRCAADALDISRRTVQDYEAGKSPVPRAVDLACRWLSANPHGAPERFVDTDLSGLIFYPAKNE